MEIANVDARDMGTYKAVARNASGEGHATINLTFEEGMKIGTKNEGIMMCKNNRYLAMQWMRNIIVAIYFLCTCISTLQSYSIISN